MLARIVCTALALALAAGNFFGGVLLPPGPLNPFGVLFLAVAGAFWFGWEVVQDAYADQEERRRAGRKIPHPLFVRFAPALGALASRDESRRRRALPGRKLRSSPERGTMAQGRPGTP